jgi:hypothetical protein
MFFLASLFRPLVRLDQGLLNRQFRPDDALRYYPLPTAGGKVGPVVYWYRYPRGLYSVIVAIRGSKDTMSMREAAGV